MHVAVEMNLKLQSVDALVFSQEPTGKAAGAFPEYLCQGWPGGRALSGGRALPGETYTAQIEAVFLQSGPQTAGHVRADGAPEPTVLLCIRNIEKNN